MDKDEDIALLVVKKQLTHCKNKNITKQECKDLLAWWKAHQVQFSYVGFVAQQTLGIVGSQIETKWVFNIVGICTNLQEFRLGMDNLEMVINIYKN
jgi:hypothetical protein